MATYINNLHSTVRTVDTNALLTPEVMQQIVETVLQAVDERRLEQNRERANRRVTPGVAYDLEQEE